jgi:hypothetical protein
MQKAQQGVDIHVPREAKSFQPVSGTITFLSILGERRPLWENEIEV